MVTLIELIEKSKPSWQVARASIQSFDNPNNPTKFEFKGDENDWYWKEKIKEMGLQESDIQYHCLFFVSDESKGRVGYQMMHVFLRADKSVLCIEFSDCTEAFLNITSRLGMVNGVVYRNRIKLRSEDSVVFFL